MIEVKCAGRGGQGAVVFSQLLAIAAFNDGRYSQAMPTFGVERRGAPSFGFIRIDVKPINLREQIYDPDILVVLDPSLLADKSLVEGVKKGGVIIINTSKDYNFPGYTTVCIEASIIALKIFNADIVNTAMLGAFASLTKIVSLDSVLKACEEVFEGAMLEKNKQAIKEVYDSCLTKKCDIRDFFGKSKPK